MTRVPKYAWLWLAAVVAAWFVNRALDRLAAQAGARQKAIDKETEAFGLN